MDFLKKAEGERYEDAREWRAVAKDLEAAAHALNGLDRALSPRSYRNANNPYPIGRVYSEWTERLVGKGRLSWAASDALCTAQVIGGAAESVSAATDLPPPGSIVLAAAADELTSAARFVLRPRFEVEMYAAWLHYVSSSHDSSKHPVDRSSHVTGTPRGVVWLDTIGRTRVFLIGAARAAIAVHGPDTGNPALEALRSMEGTGLPGSLEGFVYDSPDLFIRVEDGALDVTISSSLLATLYRRAEQVGRRIQLPDFLERHAQPALDAEQLPPLAGVARHPVRSHEPPISQLIL